MIAQSAFADGGLRSHRAGPAGALGCYFGHVPDAAARFDAVLFDLDGVLVDSEPRWNDVRIAYAGARGLAWTHDDQRACMGGNSRQWAEIMRERLGLADEPVERIEADSDRDRWFTAEEAREYGFIDKVIEHSAAQPTRS